MWFKIVYDKHCWGYEIHEFHYLYDSGSFNNNYQAFNNFLLGSLNAKLYIYIIAGLLFESMVHLYFFAILMILDMRYCQSTGVLDIKYIKWNHGLGQVVLSYRR